VGHHLTTSGHQHQHQQQQQHQHHIVMNLLGTENHFELHLPMIQVPFHVQDVPETLHPLLRFVGLLRAIELIQPEIHQVDLGHQGSKVRQLFVVSSLATKFAMGQ